MEQAFVSVGTSGCFWSGRLLSVGEEDAKLPPVRNLSLEKKHAKFWRLEKKAYLCAAIVISNINN